VLFLAVLIRAIRHALKHLLPNPESPYYRAQFAYF
jgi:hypothetical protein